jgi:peptide-methionine (S)-S-oxide reductase
MTGERETATLAAGCFWCVEAIFSRLRGVERAVSGYAGGTVENPTYEEVCTGRTGHAEAVQVSFDPGTITFAEILDVFWHSHDPTTLNQQGADVGTQYRSAIFCHDARQRETALRSREEAQSLWPVPIATEIVPFTVFYPAEGYHQHFFRDNREQPYCRLVIDPKIAKLREEFASRLKEPGEE